MKKLCLIVILLFLFSFTALAAEEDKNTFTEEIKSELFGIIDKDVMGVLEEIGITEESFDEIYKFSMKNISSFFNTTLKDKSEKCIHDFFLLLTVILIVGVISSVATSEKNVSFVSMLCVCVVALLTLKSVSSSLSACISVLRLSGNFMKGFVPVYTLLISFSGNPTSALTYNTAVMAFAQLLSAVISNICSDLVGVMLCLSVAFSFNENINTARIINSINKIISLVLGFFSCMFTGFLSIKNILSTSVDTLSVKGIRFLISSLIPVVGSSISEAYSSLLGSINLIKGSVALVGVLVLIIINLPVVIETAIYYFSFNALSYISDTLNLIKVSEVLRCVAGAIRFLLLLCVFEMFILIISTGILLSVKGTV